jgi:hypothetical protein
MPEIGLELSSAVIILNFVCIHANAWTHADGHTYTPFVN